MSSYQESESDKSPYDIISDYKDKLFDFPIAWYSGADKVPYDNFKTMFCLTHYMDEIGFETIGQFKLQLCATLTELMPYYTDLYAKTVLPVYDIFVNHDFTSTTLTTTSDDSISNLLSHDSQSIHSDTPQINFDGEDFASSLDRSKESAQSHATATGTNDSIKKDSGYMGDKSDAVLKYRETIININRDILRQCDKLFMGIFNVPDFNFTARNNIGKGVGCHGFIDRFYRTDT